MLLRRVIRLSFLLLVCGQVFSQYKSIQAVKISQPPKIDGLLDDSVWQNVTPATGFIQNYPSYGQQASQRTEVKITYDNSAIYIGAYLYDDPSLIRKQLTARDEEQQSDLDFFSVFLDTYNDHQNGFQFLVTSSNVQTDARLSPNYTIEEGEYGDKTWDAVWDSKVSIAADGWMVEMRIPYLSLRFSKKERQDWGIQLLRSVRRNNEMTFWSPVDPKVNGFVNQFGILQNLQDIKPPLRLSFSPYVSVGYRGTPESSGYKNEQLASGGMDVKIGINESFTLDATLIPDFGQVISDNIVNNLTPYEIRFADYRPFFTEGTEIFNKGGLFYSRRIGAMPGGYYDVIDIAGGDPNIEIVKNPARTQLYNGLKFSGRTKKKLGIGVFNAVTAPMYATVRDKTTRDKTKMLTEPLSNYNIIVLDQALKGRSFITFTNTNVLRNGNERDANVSGLDFSFYDRKNVFNIKGYLHYSKVYTASPYDGYNTSLRIGKVSGRVQYYVQNVIRSDRYDPTDLGYLNTPNLNINTWVLSYNQFTPTKSFLNYSYEVSGTYSRIYRPDRFNSLTLRGEGYWTFKNFWEATASIGYLPDQHDYFVLGRSALNYARRPAYGYAGLEGNTDSRKRFLFSYELLLADFFKTPGKKYHIAEGGLRYRFSNKFSLELSHRHEAETNYIVYAGKETVSGDPIIAFVDFKDVTSILSGIYNFTPRINLTLRARHYWSQVLYDRFANVDTKGNPVDRPFIPNMDQNFNVFNLDAFFTWDFRLGSRLILGYKNALGEDEVADGTKNRDYIRNLGETFSLRHGHELTLRFIYFLDYSQLKRRR
ncbi:MAG: carbohydrate binding family 9 domain-containing protein [Chitinophagaceae bacterium]|nr:carbohydrate binding family 9 domain-containing protein [Chitinophagaceae bacterium]